MKGWIRNATGHDLALQLFERKWVSVNQIVDGKGILLENTTFEYFKPLTDYK